MREAAKDQPIEKVGAELRAMMPFLKKKKKKPEFRKKPRLAPKAKAHPRLQQANARFRCRSRQQPKLHSYTIFRARRSCP